jgi:hypothetical protein
MRRLNLILALLLLNVSLTFENVWPTPAITWHGGVSIELAAVVFLLAIVAILRDHVPAGVVRGVAVLWIALALGRYAEVTAPALYGRDVNLYWDLRFIPDVVHMVTRVAPAWLVAASVGAIVVIIAGLYLIFRWAFGRVAAAMADLGERRALIPGCLTVIAFFAAHEAGITAGRAFTAPVTATYARQIRFVVEAIRGSKSLAPSPPMNSDLSRIKGADVFVIFIESYGAISYQRPEIASKLDAVRERFAADARDTHRSVVSAYVKSPTFGGSSWLAHISLLSGIEVRDPDTNAKLMTAQRDTLVRAFDRGGFRTVGLMPGLRQNWPEGGFYGFDEIYGANRLDYWGPEFGWFAIPDQFSLYRIDELEVRKSPRAPLFVFFPTISTHFPFHPTPPYQPNWQRMTDRKPFDGPDIVRAYSRQPDWSDFGPGYVDAMAYDFASIGGFLRRESDRDLVMVLLGDHQPAAAVSGEGATWDVPVHVIASESTRKAVLDRLRDRGLRDGLTPLSPSIGGIHQLLPILLEAFGDPINAEHAEHAEK